MTALQSTTLSLAGRPLTVFSTFHPAAVLRDPNKIHAVKDHMQLVLDYLQGVLVPSLPPLLSVPFSPSKE